MSSRVIQRMSGGRFRLLIEMLPQRQQQIMAQSSVTLKILKSQLCIPGFLRRALVIGRSCALTVIRNDAIAAQLSAPASINVFSQLFNQLRIYADLTAQYLPRTPSLAILESSRIMRLLE
jgi:hypothetical protein